MNRETLRYVHERNFGARLSEFTLKGLRAVALENRRLRVGVLVDKGTDIYEFLHKPSDTDFMWRSPLGIRNPALLVPTLPRAEGNFLDYYEGGWQELFPTCGDPADFGGSGYGIHGEVCLIPWEFRVVEDLPELVTVEFWVRTYRAPFLLTKRLSLAAESPTLVIEESCTNEGEQPVNFMWGHHPAFGPPFMNPACRIDTDARRVLTHEFTVTQSRLAPRQDAPWPVLRGANGSPVDLSRVGGPELRSLDWAYLTEFASGWYALTNTASGVGFALSWDAKKLPYALYWQVYRGSLGQPWWGRTYNVALEPQSTFPANYATGSPLLELEPGATMSLRLEATAYSGFSRVRQAGLGAPVEGDLA